MHAPTHTKIPANLSTDILVCGSLVFVCLHEASLCGGVYICVCTLFFIQMINTISPIHGSPIKCGSLGKKDELYTQFSMSDNHHFGLAAHSRLKLTLVPHLMAYVDLPWKGLPGILWANEWLCQLDLVISGVGGRCDPDVILMFEDSIPL